MAFKRNSTPTKLFLIPLIILLSVTACSLPSISGDKLPGLEDAEEKKPQGEDQAVIDSALGFQVPASMGFVFDPKGNPISNATLQSGDSSDLNGLLMSSGKTYAEEWAVVEASGYVAGFAQAKQTMAEAYVFEVRLTPLTAVIRLDEDINQSMGSGDLRDPEIEVSFPRGAFNSFPVIAGLAEINPLQIGPLFEPLDNSQQLHLQRAVGLQALNSQMENTSLASGITLEIAIRDDGELTEPITIAAFDPHEGVWHILPKPCSRRDETHVFCEVDQVSPLIGLFTEQDFLWMPDLADLQARGSGQPGLMALNLKPLTGKLQQSGECDGAVGEAIDLQLQSYNVIIGDMLKAGASLNSDTMAGLMNDYADLAFGFTDLCKNEKGKAALLQVLQVELALGLEFGDNWGWDPTGVTDKITELTIEIAQKALAEGKCLDMKEALNALKEAKLLGVADNPLPGGDTNEDGETETIEEAFDRKKEEWSEECDLWMGTITIMHFPAGAHFGVENWTALSVNNTWTETHDIRISTHPKTQAITGRSKVTLKFPPIMYAKTGSDDPCDRNNFQAYYGLPSEHMEVSGNQQDFENPPDPENQIDPELQEIFQKYKENPQSLTPEEMVALGEMLENLSDPDNQEDTTTENNGSPSPGNLEYGFDVTFSGFYDGTTFSISDLEYNCYAQILQFIHNESEEDDECVVDFEASIPVHNYTSYLAHGFYGSPPITLQEILETPADTSGDFGVIRGSEDFSNPSPEIGSYPFDSSSVIWELIHVQNQDSE
jgi:hypothetical protein